MGEASAGSRGAIRAARRGCVGRRRGSRLLTRRPGHGNATAPTCRCDPAAAAVGCADAAPAARRGGLWHSAGAARSRSKRDLRVQLARVATASSVSRASSHAHAHGVTALRMPCAAIRRHRTPPTFPLACVCICICVCPSPRLRLPSPRLRPPDCRHFLGSRFHATTSAAMAGHIVAFHGSAALRFTGPRIPPRCRTACEARPPAAQAWPATMTHYGRLRFRRPRLDSTQPYRFRSGSR